jgi:hypothetical protein
MTQSEMEVEKELKGKHLKSKDYGNGGFSIFYP